MICGPGGSKSRLAKAAGAEPCGQMKDEKLHVIVARSAFLSQNAQNTLTSDHFCKLRCRKKCTPLWREARLQVKSVKSWRGQSTFGSWDVQKAHAVVARSTFRSQRRKKKWGARGTFGRSDVVSRGRRKGLYTLSKLSKTWGFCGISKIDGKRGTYAEDLARFISRGRCSSRDMFIRDVRRSGRSFPERGCILEHQIFRFAEMILRDRCSTSYDLASLFRARRTSDRWTGKIAKRIGTRPSALHWTFYFWRKSRRIEISANPLQAVWNELGNRDLYGAMLTAADLTHAAYDCAKKNPPS